MHIICDVSVDVQCGGAGDVADDGGQGLHIHPMFQRIGGENVPLRYNNDKPENSVIARV